MRLDPILTKAVRLAKNRKYDDAIKTLENEANRYYGSFIYYYILGVSYLHSNIYGVALTYLRHAYEQKMRDPSTLLGLAALYLNHGDTDKAVNLYLEIQSIDASNKLAKKALQIIRKNPSPEEISTWIDTGKLHVLFPPLPKAGVSTKSVVLWCLAGLAGLCIVFGILFKTGFISLPQGRGQRELPVEITLSPEERNNPVQTGGSYRYVLTRSQVLDEYNDALKFFAEYRDDAAKVRLNRILESNASEPIKNRARLIVSYAEVPGFDTLKDRFSYSDVTRDPFIYRDCHVIWRGMATNLVVQQHYTAFDFLVGYDTYRTMDGIVHVEYNFAIPVNTERPVEILARVVPVSIDRQADIKLQGVALNQAGLLEGTKE
ncbi:MAG: tetratricopeptide repeat protein [Treponema sp.]|jgi:tetratricopeptide (TPR) repeat protein|nr:tetratricopeptide repeat protein [Treponema sp.]